MKLFKKSTMSLALTAAMVGGVVMSQQVAANQDVDNGATPVYVSNNSLGQALIYPYYTVRGGKKSIINVFNTSNKTIAAKVRFHESHNSRDVLDFNVILSPYDKWSGTIEMGTTGPIFKSRDNTCTVPQIPSTGVQLNKSAYSNGSFADVDADQTADRMSEGYVEVIAMGQADAGDAFGTDSSPAVGFNKPYTANNSGNVAYNATHVNGVPRDCGAVSAKFVAGSTGTAATSYPDTVTWAGNANADGNAMAENEFDVMVDDFNPLRGALSIIGADDGVGFGTSALAIADWTQTGGLNMVTAQEFPYFLEPTIATNNGTWDASTLNEVDKALEAHTVINEWSNNPINGAATDWVVQFPTKAYHVDVPYADKALLTGCVGTNIQAAVNSYRTPAAAIIGGCTPATIPADLADLINPFEQRFGPTGSPISVVTKTVDKEERIGTPSGVSFSPAQPGATNALPWESNIVTFGGPSVLSSSSPELTLDPVGDIAGAESNGIAFMSFDKADTVGASTVNNHGLPVIGFVAKERDQGDSAKAYGQIMSHSYENKDGATTPDL